MRIIRDASQEIEKKIICKNCGVELGYLPVDILVERNKDFDGGINTERFIICISCMRKIAI